MLSRFLARALLLLLPCLSGCAEELSPVGLLVVVDADSAMRAQLDRIEVRTASANATFYVNRAPEGKALQAFPFSFEIALRGKASGKAEIRAFGADGERVRRTIALTGGGRGRRILRVLLSEGCAGRFTTCDAQNKGTCIDCGPGCESETVVFDELSPADKSDGITSMTSNTCSPSSPSDRSDGGEASVGSTVGDAATNDAGAGSNEGGTDSGTDSGTLGGSDVLTIDVPAVVAAPGCVPLTITRPVVGPLSTQRIVFDLGAPPRAALWEDSACSATPMTSQGFAQDATTATYYLAPHELTGPRVEALRIVAQTSSASGERTISLRMRAKQVVRGRGVGCALLWDGSVHCAGRVDVGHFAFVQHILSREDGVNGGVLLPTRARKLSGLDRTTKLSVGERTACALTNGKVTCWGENGMGNLGDGSTTSFTSNQDALGLTTGVDQIDVGGPSSCAVRRSDHKMFCWGDNRESQCTPAQTQSYSTPVEVTLPGVTGNITECASGGVYTCARLEAGDVYCWGRRAESAPMKINLDGLPARHIDAAGGAVCAIAVSGGQDRLYCWNWDSGGVATRVTGYPSTATIHALAPQQDASCAHIGDELYCWGTNPAGWLGTESSTETLTSATRVPLAGKLESIAISESGGISLSAVVDGLVYAWGYFAGGLGIDDKLGLISSPTLVADLSGTAFDSLTLSETTGCGIQGGKVSCWGSGYGSELGNGKNGIMGGQFSNVPVALLNLQSGLVRQVEAFSSGSLALEDTDNVYSWGYNGAGQDGNGQGFGNLVAPVLSTPIKAIPGTISQIAAAGYHGCARTTDGAISCWGSWDDGVLKPTTVMTAQQGVTDLALGDREGCIVVNKVVTCFRRSSGAWTTRTITALGSDVDDVDMSGTSACANKGGRGLCAFNSSLEDATEMFPSGVSELRVGRWHACARKLDGSLWCAGYNDFAQQGQGNVIPGLRAETKVPLQEPVTAFDCAEFLTCARDVQGVKCWGDNTRNQMALEPFVFSKPTLVAPYAVE